MPEDEIAQRRLIRTIAREVAYEVLYEHLEDCVHKQKKASPQDLEE